MQKAQPKDLELYATPNGRTPFTEWLEALKDIKARAKIRVRLDRLRVGNLGDCQPVGEGVSELRIDFGPGSVLLHEDSSKQTIAVAKVPYAATR